LRQCHFTKKRAPQLHNCEQLKTVGDYFEMSHKSISFFNIQYLRHKLIDYRVMSVCVGNVAVIGREGKCIYGVNG
jgi:hypothetical protein